MKAFPWSSLGWALPAKMNYLVHDLIQQMEQHVATLSKKKEDGTKELEETNKKLSILTERVNKLKETY